MEPSGLGKCSCEQKQDANNCPEIRKNFRMCCRKSLIFVNCFRLYLLLFQAYLLEDVISNMQLVPDYYQRTTLSFILKESDPLLKLLRFSQKW